MGNVKRILGNFQQKKSECIEESSMVKFLSMNLFQGGASPESVLLHDDWRSCMLDLLIFSNRSLSFFFVFFKSSNITDMKKSMFFHCWVFFYLIGTQPVYRVLTTIFAMIGKFGISASFAVIYIYSAELLPTVVR